MQAKSHLKLDSDRQKPSSRPTTAAEQRISEARTSNTGGGREADRGRQAQSLWPARRHNDPGARSGGPQRGTG
jgi:hypothetical protein